ncbi:hypothetical protein P4H27_07460 [Paenibacillus taichungensis]|uniref:hypothetical protein n=1 Tax=Paenibacillus taichungensis TaxID=484184 RepID=UPI002DB87971|nr:hypothetical protein [Paenibacillus taichungensis]MEC0106774.1 hypothetical protein [Paenibacillus taichungensis]MEC0195296.1 hypothetical protein [Paenibacillus taichungensis]
MEKLTLEQKKYVIDTARKSFRIVFNEKLKEGDIWTQQTYYEANTRRENIYYEACVTVSSLIHHIMNVKFGLTGSENQVIECTFSANGYQYAHTYNLVCDEPIDATIDQFNNRTNMDFSIYENNSQYYENNSPSEPFSEIGIQREVAIFNVLDRKISKGDLGVKAVAQLGEDYCLKNNTKTILRIGEIFKSEHGCSYCVKALDTLKYYEYPLAMKYLEIEILSEPWKGDDGYSCLASEVKVLREIPLNELRKDNAFNDACIRNEQKQKESQKQFEIEIQEMRAERERREKTSEIKLKYLKKIAFFPLIVTVVLLIILPLVLYYLGVGPSK